MHFTKLFTIGLLALLCSNSVTAKPSSRQNRLYQTLDSLLEHQSELIEEKKARIRMITDGAATLNLTPEQAYLNNTRLYDEYKAFQFDSAFYYINKNLEMHVFEHDPIMEAENLVRMSHILAVSGLFDKAEEMIDRIHPEALDVAHRVEYYNQRGELNLYHSEMALSTPFFQAYIDSAQYYRQLILQIAPKDSYDYIFNQATYTCERGDPDGAIRQLDSYLKKLKPGDRRYSIISSTLAYFYQTKNDNDMQEHYLLLSAISDIRGAILENNSLRELSSILLERGDYTKAYAYLSHASEDAKAYGSRLRSMQISRLAPLITKAYDMERNHTERRQIILLALLSVIALLLLGTIVNILTLLKKRRLGNEKMSQLNEELLRQNEEIQVMNMQMKESNRIKDEYIGRFLVLSSNFIHRGEERNKKMQRLARERKIEELFTELKNAKPLNESVQLFHQNFDTAFLNIYPHFIEEVNRLMTDDNQFVIDTEGGRLTTELRVLALIRLGIVDNQSIADILRSSITTIYTYRSKIKARARVKDTFEEDIRRTGTY